LFPGVKGAPPCPLASLSFETAALAPLALAWLALGAAAPGGTLAGSDTLTSALLVASGPITAAPLIAFAAAARRLPFTVLGLFQYASPTSRHYRHRRL
jgi:chloramphenicol-sensitive protein RarD